MLHHLSGWRGWMVAGMLASVGTVAAEASGLLPPIHFELGNTRVGIWGGKGGISLSTETDEADGRYVYDTRRVGVGFSPNSDGSHNVGYSRLHEEGDLRTPSSSPGLSYTERFTIRLPGERK